MSPKSTFVLGWVSILILIVSLFFTFSDYSAIGDLIHLIGCTGFVGFSWFSYKNKFFG